MIVSNQFFFLHNSLVMDIRVVHIPLEVPAYDALDRHVLPDREIFLGCTACLSYECAQIQCYSLIK